MTAKYKIKLVKLLGGGFKAVINGEPWVIISIERRGSKPSRYWFRQIHGSTIMPPVPVMKGFSGNRRCVEVYGVPKDMPSTIKALERKLVEMADAGWIESASAALVKKNARDAERKIEQDKDAALERAREAGPELLVALRGLADVTDALAECANLGMADDALKIARAAIKKAEGNDADARQSRPVSRGVRRAGGRVVDRRGVLLFWEMTMWLFISDAFLSIVHKDCARDELCVRARRKGDIERIFPRATVRRSTNTDYLYRAIIKRTDVEEALVGEARRITYSNFKDSIREDDLHTAAMRVWTAVASLQTPGPYSGGSRLFPAHQLPKKTIPKRKNR